MRPPVVAELAAAGLAAAGLTLARMALLPMARVWPIAGSVAKLLWGSNHG